MFIDVITVFLLSVGAVFTLLSAIGVVRMPDLFTRLQSTTKASTLGIVCTMAGVALNFGDSAVSALCLLVILFVFLTAPVAAHMLSRAAYFVGLPLWEGTVRDDLRPRVRTIARTPPRGSVM
jgi:multicomponent Na+:H+ antiporter subunit G